MTSFKVGDKVVLTDAALEEDDLDSYSSKGFVHTITKDQDEDGDYRLDVEGDPDDYFYANEKQIIKAQKTFENLEVGDTIIYNGGYSSEQVHTVEGVVGNVVFVLPPEATGDSIETYTVNYLKESDEWVLPESEKEEEKTELTLKEIADKFNVPVDQLRVKE